MSKIGLFVLALISISLAVAQPTLHAAATSGEVKFKGTIQAIAFPLQLIVSGVTVVVNAQTVFKGGILSFSDLKIGMTVKVTGTLQVDGSVLALGILLIVPD